MRLLLPLLTFLNTYNITTFAYTNCKPTSPLTTTQATPLELAQALVGVGVEIVAGSVTFTGFPITSQHSMVAKFAGGSTLFQNNDDMDTGIVLTTGDVNQPLCRPQGTIDSYDWSGGNTETIDIDLINICKTFYTSKSLDSSACNQYEDQAKLEFQFKITARAKMGIKYSFASEEWPDFVENLYADGFAFFIDGENIALTPQGQGVSIGSINCKKFTGAHSCENCKLYTNNGGGVDATCPNAVATTPDNEQKISYNAYTHVLRGEKILNAGEHTIKMVVADQRDGMYDSAVFIAAKSLVAPNPICYTVTQIGQCSTTTGFQETAVQPVEVFPQGHPVLTRTDCDGAPGALFLHYCFCLYH